MTNEKKQKEATQSKKWESCNPEFEHFYEDPDDLYQQRKLYGDTFQMSVYRRFIHCIDIHIFSPRLSAKTNLSKSESDINICQCREKVNRKQPFWIILY